MAHSDPDTEGRLLTVSGPQVADSAVRSGATRGGELRVVGDLKKGQTNRAAAASAPANLLTSDYFASAIMISQERETNRCLAKAKGGLQGSVQTWP